MRMPLGIRPLFAKNDGEQNGRDGEQKEEVQAQESLATEKPRDENFPSGDKSHPTPPKPTTTSQSSATRKTTKTRQQSVIKMGFMAVLQIFFCLRICSSSHKIKCTTTRQDMVPETITVPDDLPWPYGPDPGEKSK